MAGIRSFLYGAPRAGMGCPAWDAPHGMPRMGISVPRWLDFFGRSAARFVFGSSDHIMNNNASKRGNTYLTWELFAAKTLFLIGAFKPVVKFGFSGYWLQYW